MKKIKNKTMNLSLRKFNFQMKKIKNKTKTIKVGKLKIKLITKTLKLGESSKRHWVMIFEYQTLAPNAAS